MEIILGIALVTEFTSSVWNISCSEPNRSEFDSCSLEVNLFLQKA